jgi:hypothetical protein
VPSFTRNAPLLSSFCYFILTLLSVKLPKSFVAIDLSEKMTDSSDRRNNGKSKDGDGDGLEDGDRGRSEERKEDHELPAAVEIGTVGPPSLSASEEGKRGMQPAGLPPPALDA